MVLLLVVHRAHVSPEVRRPRGAERALRAQQVLLLPVHGPNVSSEVAHVAGLEGALRAQERLLPVVHRGNVSLHLERLRGGKVALSALVTPLPQVDRLDVSVHAALDRAEAAERATRNGLILSAHLGRGGVSILGIRGCQVAIVAILILNFQAQ